MAPSSMSTEKEQAIDDWLPITLVQERQVVVLRLPQRHGHGRRRRAQPALRHVGARMVRDPAGCIH